MSNVNRANWAANAPWLGISGRPTNFGITDISQLTGNGFAVGTVARWNGIRFVPYTIPPSSTPVTPPSSLPAQFQITWDPPSIAPLQTATQDFPLIGAVPGSPLAWGISFDPGFCWFNAMIVTNDAIRLTILNMDLTAVDLGPGVWNIQPFN